MRGEIRSLAPTDEAWQLAFGCTASHRDFTQYLPAGPPNEMGMGPPMGTKTNGLCRAHGAFRLRLLMRSDAHGREKALVWDDSRPWPPPAADGAAHDAAAGLRPHAARPVRRAHGPGHGREPGRAGQSAQRRGGPSDGHGAVGHTARPVPRSTDGGGWRPVSAQRGVFRPRP